MLTQQQPYQRSQGMSLAGSASYPLAHRAVQQQWGWERLAGTWKLALLLLMLFRPRTAVKGLPVPFTRSSLTCMIDISAKEKEIKNFSSLFMYLDSSFTSRHHGLWPSIFDKLLFAPQKLFMLSLSRRTQNSSAEQLGTTLTNCPVFFLSDRL